MTASSENEPGDVAETGSAPADKDANAFVLSAEERARKAAQDKALLDKALHEQRKSERRAFKAKALVAFEDAPPANAVTVDIGTGGLGLAGLPRQLKPGQRVRVTCDLVSLDKTYRMVVVCEVMHCLFSGNGFKAGVQFLDLDSALLPVITRIVHS